MNTIKNYKHLTKKLYQQKQRYEIVKKYLKKKKELDKLESKIEHKLSKEKEM